MGSWPRRIVFVLTQDRGGPVDLTVALALTFAKMPGGPQVTVIGPKPVTSSGELGALHVQHEIPSKTDMAGRKRLHELIESINPDIVHAQDRRAGLMCLGLPDKYPVLWTYHGVPEDVDDRWVRGQVGGKPPSLRSRLVLSADRWVLPRIDHITVPSRELRDFVVSTLHADAERCQVLPNGVPLIPAHQWDSISTLTFTGALVPRKGVDLLIRAHAQVVRDHPQLRLRIVGDGPQRERLERLTDELATNELVEFVGYREDVPDQLAQAECFVLPSWHENQPLALLEAMGAGLVCIATDVGGVGETLSENAGLVVPRGDVTALVQAISAVASNREFARRLATIAARRARSHYSIAACAAAHLECYRSLKYAPVM